MIPCSHGHMCFPALRAAPRPLLPLFLLAATAVILAGAPCAEAEVAFAPARRDFICGRLARDLVPIDFDEDGHLDIACVRFTLPGTVTLLKGDGSGGFTLFDEFATGDGASSILAADFDEDGHVDLITAGFIDRVTGTIGLHRSDGHGVFKTTFLPYPGENPFHVNGADFDGDGHLDLVAGGTGDNDRSVRVFRGDGTGTFTVQQVLPGGLVPQHTAIGDIDADGDLDLAVADSEGDVLLYFGDGAGTFAPAGVLDVVAPPVWIDIRAMGDPDRPFLAVAERGDLPGDPDVAEVFRWDPQAQALSRIGQVAAPGDPISITFLEPVFFHDTEKMLSGERLPGLAVASQTSSELRLFRTIAHEPLVLVTQDSPTAVRIADWNGDGIRDIALPGFNVESVSLFWGSGALVDRAPSLAVGGLPLTLHAVDMDGDPYPDLALLRRSARRVTVLRGGALRYGVPTFDAIDIGDVFPDVPTGFAAFDLEDDQAPDFVVGRAVGPQLWILRSSQGYARTEEFIPFGAGPTAVVAGDLDGDEHDDLAVALYLTDNFSVLFGTGAGGLAPPLLGDAGDGPIALAAADLDGNGLLDLAVANDVSRSFSVALQGPARTFTTQPELPVEVGFPRGIAAGYLDDGNTLDLAIGGELGLEIFAGDGSGRFASVRFIPTAAELEAVHIVDLDEDGWEDVVTADRIGNAVLVFPGEAPARGLGYPPLAFGVDRGPADFDAVDLDADGRLDLAVLARQAEAVSLLLTGTSGGPWADWSTEPARSTEQRAASPLRFSWAPNPFITETALRVELRRAAPVLLQIVDASGRLVATPFAGQLGAGPSALAFDGRDDHGRLLPRGVYFYRLQIGEELASGKLLRR